MNKLKQLLVGLFMHPQGPATSGTVGVPTTMSPTSEDAELSAPPDTPELFKPVTNRIEETVIPGADPMRIGRQERLYMGETSGGKYSMQVFKPVVLACGHFARTLADVAGMSSFSGRPVCPRCMTRCPLCSRLAAIQETIQVEPQVRLCPLCAEQYQRSRKWKWLRDLLLGPFLRRE